MAWMWFCDGDWDVGLKMFTVNMSSQIPSQPVGAWDAGMGRGTNIHLAGFPAKLNHLHRHRIFGYSILI